MANKDRIDKLKRDKSTKNQDATSSNTSTTPYTCGSNGTTLSENTCQNILDSGADPPTNATPNSSGSLTMANG